MVKTAFEGQREGERIKVLDHSLTAGGPESDTLRSHTIADRLDGTLHRLSRWTGYGMLGAVYLGVAQYLLS